MANHPKITKNIEKLVLLLVTTFFLIISIYLCEKFLDLKHYQPKSAFLDFTDIGQNNQYSIDQDLVYKINFNHLRNPAKPTKINHKSIAFVGDSATFSFGADNDATYPISYEKLYNQNPLNKAAIINNFGTPGYGIDQEYLLIKNYIIPQYKPDLLIWNINVNDLWDSNYMCLFTKKENNWIQISGKNNISYWYAWTKNNFPHLVSSSKLFNLLWQRLAYFITQGIGDDRHTFGCTQAVLDEKIKEEIANKINFFVMDIWTKLQKNDQQLVVTLIPYQNFFDNQISKQFLEKDYFILNKTLNTLNINFVDFNELISSHYIVDPLNNPSDEYFLSASADAAPYGSRHPNQKMYDLMAQALNDYINNSHLSF